MTYYVVKVVNTATEENKNFAGKKIVSYYGKGGHLIDSDSEFHIRSIGMTNYALKNYGYKRLCDAKKSWAFKNPENTKYWNTIVEIVPMNEVIL